MAYSKPKCAFLAKNGWEYDVFLLHAGENKEFVKKLYQKFCSMGILPFFDEFTLELGDDQEMIMDALQRSSRFIVPILTHEVKGKQWPEMEMSKALERHKKQKKVILPVFFKISPDQSSESTNQFVKEVSKITGIRLDGEEEETFVCTVVKRIKEMVIKDTLPFLPVEEEPVSGAQGESNLQNQNDGVPDQDQRQNGTQETAKLHSQTGGVCDQGSSRNGHETSLYLIMKRLILDNGIDQWSSFGHAFGFKQAKIKTLTAPIPSESGKLEALIESLKNEKGADEAAEILQKACNIVPSPITGVVRDELKKLL